MMSADQYQYNPFIKENIHPLIESLTMNVEHETGWCGISVTAPWWWNILLGCNGFGSSSWTDLVGSSEKPMIRLYF